MSRFCQGLKPISGLTGHQLMEAEKRLFDIDRDFGEILEKITHFVEKFSGYSEKVDCLTTKMNTISVSKTEYCQK